MRFNKEGQLCFTKDEVERILLYGLRNRQFQLEEKADEIAEGSFKEEDIQFYSPKDVKDPDKIKNIMIGLIEEYLLNLYRKKEFNHTLADVYAKLQQKTLFLGLDEIDEKGYQWFDSFSKGVKELQQYFCKSVEAIREDKAYAPTRPRVISLLKTYDAERANARTKLVATKTPWQKVFNRFFKRKQNRKAIRDMRKEENYQSLNVCFTVMNKTAIEEITRQDCLKLCDNIYRFPKHWNGELNEGETVASILTTGDNCISKTTVKKHLITFKEFMRFCAYSQLIPASFNEVVELPTNTEPTEIEPFTATELRKIFLPTTYPTGKSRNQQGRFWIPLIALYQGCRLNEICQLDTSDIIIEEGVECFNITPEGEKKSLKNRTSKRVIPIHPKLIEMGFEKYVDYQRKNGEQKLFPELTYSKSHGYSGSIGHWFAKYMDSIGVKGRSKVFHSFRHTFRVCATRQLIHPEYIHRICGWSEGSVGERVYGGKFNIPVLLKELSKIQYPILDRELDALKERYATSFIITAWNA